MNIDLTPTNWVEYLGYLSLLCLLILALEPRFPRLLLIPATLVRLILVVVAQSNSLHQVEDDDGDIQVWRS